jgi:hypothetical protein
VVNTLPNGFTAKAGEAEKIILNTNKIEIVAFFSTILQ